MATPFPWKVYRPGRVDLEGASSVKATASDAIGEIYGNAELHDNQLFLSVDAGEDIVLGDVVEPLEPFEPSEI